METDDWRDARRLPEKDHSLLAFDEDEFGNLKRRRHTKMPERKSGVRDLDRVTKGKLRAKIAMLYADDFTRAEIAEAINKQFGLTTSPGSIEYQIKGLVNRYRELSMASIEKKQALALARIDQIEEMATEAYFKSTQGKRVVNFKRQLKQVRSKEWAEKVREQIDELAAQYQAEGREFTINDIGDLETILVTTAATVDEYSRLEHNDAGDPRFLDLMLKCHQERCRIWGLYLRNEDRMTADQEMAAMSDEDRAMKLTTLLANVAGRVSKASVHSPIAPPAPFGAETDEDRAVLEAFNSLDEEEPNEQTDNESEQIQRADEYLQDRERDNKGLIGGLEQDGGQSDAEEETD